MTGSSSGSNHNSRGWTGPAIATSWPSSIIRRSPRVPTAVRSPRCRRQRCARDTLLCFAVTAWTILFSGHDHLFEHWVERYEDSEGRARRMDHITTGGGGAPLYAYRGEPDLREYLKMYAAEKVSLEHIVRPGMDPGDNPYHYLLVQVDGDRIRVEVVGVDWGRGFQPYRSNATDLQDASDGEVTIGERTGVRSP